MFYYNTMNPNENDTLSFYCEYCEKTYPLSYKVRHKYNLNKVDQIIEYIQTEFEFEEEDED